MNLELFKRDLERAEGRVRHLYLCTAGHVTIGVGCQIFSVQEALALPLAPRDAIVPDYQAVRASKPGMRANAYAAITHARMSDADIDTLLARRVEAFVAEMRAKLPALDSMPDPAQRALVDMAFNLGLGKLLGEYHNLLAAVRAHDWARAAAECHRRGISDARNQDTAALFLSAGA